MPPPTTINDPAAVIRHLTRLLGALCVRSKGGELRISQEQIDALKAEEPARALFEYFDAKTGQAVLQFRHKALATYLVEEKACQVSETKSTQPLPTQTQGLDNTSGSNQGRRPLTDEQLMDLEMKAKKARLARQFRRASGTPQPVSSNPLDEILLS